MSSFQNGKIYVIKSKYTPECYIGSTFNTLYKRFSSHKSTYKKFIKTGKNTMATVNKILKHSDAWIELIENYPCNTKRELLDREGYFIRKIPCVNVQIQGRNKKQWDEDNKEHRKEYTKKYMRENKEVLKERKTKWDNSENGKKWKDNYKATRSSRNIKVVCPKCNCGITKEHLVGHQKTMRCNKIQANNIFNKYCYEYALKLGASEEVAKTLLIN
jgi:hypothetical protein